MQRQKFTTQGIVGAKKFALKPQNLFPAFKGIATLDVHLAAEMKIIGDSDWYALLSVNASTDDETVKKQYRKFVLQLHPDKFNFLDEAFLKVETGFPSNGTSSKF